MFFFYTWWRRSLDRTTTGIFCWMCQRNAIANADRRHLPPSAVNVLNACRSGELFYINRHYTHHQHIINKQVITRGSLETVAKRCNGEYAWYIMPRSWHSSTTWKSWCVTSCQFCTTIGGTTANSNNSCSKRALKLLTPMARARPLAYNRSKARYAVRQLPLSAWLQSIHVTSRWHSGQCNKYKST